MKLEKFSKDEIFFNTIKANPKVTFTFAAQKTFLNNVSSSNTNVPNGSISAYDLSVNRTGDERIYQFLNKDSDFASWTTTSVANYVSALPGDQFKNYLALTSSVDVEYGTDLAHTVALQNIVNYYRSMSKYFDYETYIEGKAIKLISIPSVFYGSSINKGNIKLDFYYTGSLGAVAADKNRDGELIQVSGSSTGEVVGIALYNEGFFILFGTGSIGAEVVDGYETGTGTGSWVDFADTSAGVVKSSFDMGFKGTTYTPTLTMFAHAPPGKYNYSNNPTFILTGSTTNAKSSSAMLYVGTPATIANITTSSYNNEEAPFKKTTFISKVGIYDDKQRLLGIANLAEPIKKTEDASYTFKIRLDL